MKGQPRLQFIGTGAAGSLGRASDYFQQVAEAASSVDDVLAVLQANIESSRRDLAECLRGHDSFDALAFLRLTAGPWDFSEVRESETRIETSQAAQDLVALAFLDMGLPRTPLSGGNSGQPDIGEAMRLAADIVDSACTRALLQGRRLPQPLGVMAGEFPAYELSVRGRQYESVAAELNTGLFGDVSIRTIVKDALGFNLDEIRAVRAASVGLLNQRLFGARDRIGDIVQSGVSADAVDARAFLRDLNLMVSECRRFGAVTTADVAELAKVDSTTTKAILDFFSIARPAVGEDSLITSFVRGDRPAPWGCISDADEYLILNGFLGEDELRRDIERGLIAGAQTGGAAMKAWEKYVRRRAAYSESRAATLLSTLMRGIRPQWKGQKFLGPTVLEDADKLTRDMGPNDPERREYESDLLFVHDGVAICVEVKAGSITDKARGGNAKRLASDLEKTLREGNDQADRLAGLLRNNQGVWLNEHEWINLAPIKEIHSIIVMLDDMGPLSLSMNELALKGIIDTPDVPWIVSLHDLTVLSRTTDCGAQFLEYLRRRRERKLATMVSGADELDLFMWFLNGGMYLEPDPQDIAAQLPLQRPPKAARRRRYNDQPRVRVGTLTDPLDAWFYGMEGLSRIRAPKPTRREEPWVEQYLSASESIKSPGWLRFGADLVGLSGAAQRRIGSQLRQQCHRARGGQRERTLTTHGAGAWGSWLLTLAAIPGGASVDHLSHYVDAKQYQTAASRALLVLYRPDGSMFGSRYRGDPEPRTPERDAEVAALPLQSLTAMFGPTAKGSRPKKKRPRGGRAREKRKR